MYNITGCHLLSVVLLIVSYFRIKREHILRLSILDFEKKNC